MNIKTIDIELAIMKAFDFRNNIIIPNVTDMTNVLAFETDMIVVRNTGYATGFEIKISKSDLKAEFKKRQHNDSDIFHLGKSNFEKYYGKFKYFYFAVPDNLKEYALEIVPQKFGIYVYEKKLYKKFGEEWESSHFYEVRKANFLFNYKWSGKEMYELARLGAMRIYPLKTKIKKLTK